MTAFDVHMKVRVQTGDGVSRDAAAQQVMKILRERIRPQDGVIVLGTTNVHLHNLDHGECVNMLAALDEGRVFRALAVVSELEKGGFVWLVPTEATDPDRCAIGDFWRVNHLGEKHKSTQSAPVGLCREDKMRELDPEEFDCEEEQLYLVNKLVAAVAAQDGVVVDSLISHDLARQTQLEEGVVTMLAETCQLEALQAFIERDWEFADSALEVLRHHVEQGFVDWDHPVVDRLLNDAPARARR